MAESALQKASKAVAIACAATTTFVKILSLKPFKLSPNNLFKLRFKEVGVLDKTQIEAFRQTLVALLPEELRTDVEKMDLSAEIIIGLVVDHVEALLLARNA